MLLAAMPPHHLLRTIANGNFGVRDYFRLFILKRRSHENICIGKEWLSKSEESNRWRLRVETRPQIGRAT
jgi:hypothetical protein